MIVCIGEFGRSPDDGVRRGAHAVGRDLNKDAMVIWLSAAGVKASRVLGVTDEIGARPGELVQPIRDLHVTLLHLLGLDDNKLTYFQAGRFKQLAQTCGELIREILASYPFSFCPAQNRMRALDEFPGGENHG